MSRFFVPRESVKADTIIVTGKEAHHILDVMRLKQSDPVVTFDGTGNEYVGFIKKIDRKSLLIGITETRAPLTKNALSVTLIQAIPKKEKMDYIVEKSTELGVSCVVPVITDRTIPMWGQSKKELNVQRWQKIAQSASKQCGRLDIPMVRAIGNFKDAIRSLQDKDLKLIAALSEKALPLKEALNKFKGSSPVRNRISNGASIAVAIGPEGDFTKAEVDAAREAHFTLVSLGPMVLKSDTAALAVLSILNYTQGL